MAAEPGKQPITLEQEGVSAGPDRSRQLKVVLDRGLKGEYDKRLADVKRHCMALLQDFNPPTLSPKGDYPKEFIEHMEKIAGWSAYEAMRGWKFYRPVEVSHVYRHDVGELLHKLGVVGYVCGLIKTLLGKQDKGGKGGKRTSSEDKALHWCLKLLFDYSDYSKEVAMDIVAKEDFVTAAVGVLSKRDNQNILTKSSPISSSEDDHLQKVLFIIYNVARFPPNNIKMRDVGLIEALLPLLLSSKDDIQMASLGALANVVPEDKAELFSAHRKAIRYLLNKLGKANSPMFLLGPTALKAGIWSFYELGQMVRQLALNEANKRLLVEEGAIPKLLNLATTDDLPTKKVALEALWNLAFNEDNRKDMVANHKLIEAVYTSRATKELEQLGFGILWTLRKELKNSTYYAHIAMEIQQEKDWRDPADDSSPCWTPSRARILVKLSFNPYNNRMVQQIRDQLVRSGCDVISIGEKTLGERLQNVEKAMVIVICLSQEFKDSAECQTEVDFVLEKKKSIIPVVLQQPMTIDGWLRKVLDEAKSHFFTFSIALLEDDTILNEIKKKGKTVKGERKAGGEAMELSEAELDQVRLWNKTVVTKWIEQHGLPQAKLSSLSGWKIAGWFKLKAQAPEFFFRSLETKLGLSLLEGEVFSFADAIDDIPRMVAQ